MSGNREVTSEQLSSVHEGAGYNKVYPLGCRPMEDLTWFPKWESSTHSPTEEEKEEYEEDEEEEEEEDEEEGGDCW